MSASERDDTAPAPAALDLEPTDIGGPTDPETEGKLLARLNRRGFRLVMVLDTALLYAIAVGTMLVRFTFDGRPWPTYPVSMYLASFAVAVAIFEASLYFGGLYEREPRLGAPPVLPRAARQTLAAGGLVALLTLALTGAARELGLTTSRALPFPILNLVVLIVLGAVGVALSRQFAYWLRARREGPPRVILFGPEDDIARARSHLAANERVARIVGACDDPAELGGFVTGHGATDVLLLDSDWLDRLYPGPLTELEEHGVSVLLRVTARETTYGLERVREVAGLPFVLLRSQTIPRSRARFKRLFDLVVMGLTAPAWASLLLCIAAYQLVVAGRPLLYFQVRVGARGELFRMVKFRTMRVDAEADGEGARLAAADDPRVIPACGWVRATRMDELPQVWNILIGEMSLVGPRPERPELTTGFEQQIPGYARRYELPPGLTGLAQIHGRYHTDAEYKLGYDLQYLVNWSPVFDLEILARTIWVVLARRL
jgi:lipopolysaccharide/colanic/teichoic acid biosynthesis glycosyltransferase